jgi:hypothetical protein
MNADERCCSAGLVCPGQPRNDSGPGLGADRSARRGVPVALREREGIRRQGKGERRRLETLPRRASLRYQDGRR